MKTARPLATRPARTASGWSSLAGAIAAVGTAVAVGTGYLTTATPLSVSVMAYSWGASASNGGTLNGVAPMAVLFDATGTTHNDTGVTTYFECGYHHDYGYATPTTPGSWTHSGKPKGNDVGRFPLAGHVYETPGTYTYSLNVEDAVGNVSQTTITIVVADPDTYWTTGGRSTVHLATTDSWPTWAANTRYQFDRGGDYSSKGAITLNALSTIAFTATGSGAKPLMPQITLESATVTTRAWSNKVLFADIEMAFVQGMPCEYVHMYRCKTGQVNWGNSIEWYWIDAMGATQPSGWFRPRFISEYECERDPLNAAGSYGCFGCASHWLILGTEHHNSYNHNLRAQAFYKMVYAHNYAHDSSSNSTVNVTWHANGNNADYGVWDAYAGRDQEQSRFLVAAYNTLGDSNDTAAIAASSIRPQNPDGSDERIEDCIFTHNAEARAAGGSLELRGKNILVADNTMNGYAFQTVVGTWDTPLDWHGPYFSDTATPDAVQIFAAPAEVLPDKAVF